MGLISYSCDQILGLLWTDSHQIWAVEVFLSPIYGIQNAKMQKSFLWRHHFGTLMIVYHCVLPRSYQRSFNACLYLLGVFSAITCSKILKFCWLFLNNMLPPSMRHYVARLFYKTQNNICMQLSLTDLIETQKGHSFNSIKFPCEYNICVAFIYCGNRKEAIRLYWTKMHFGIVYRYLLLQIN